MLGFLLPTTSPHSSTGSEGVRGRTQGLTRCVERGRLPGGRKRRARGAGREWAARGGPSHASVPGARPAGQGGAAASRAPVRPRAAGADPPRGAAPRSGLVEGVRAAGDLGTDRSHRPARGCYSGHPRSGPGNLRRPTQGAQPGPRESPALPPLGRPDACCTALDGSPPTRESLLAHHPLPGSGDPASQLGAIPGFPDPGPSARGERHRPGARCGGHIPGRCCHHHPSSQPGSCFVLLS